MLIQLRNKHKNALLLLLTLEGLTLAIVFLWAASLHTTGVTFRGIVVFFLAAVSEACAGLAILVGASREAQQTWGIGTR